MRLISFRSCKVATHLSIEPLGTGNSETARRGYVARQMVLR